MHVVIVSDFADVNGGSAKVAISTAIGLARRGAPVTFFCAINPIHPELLDAGVNVHCLGIESVWQEANPFTAALRGIWNPIAAQELQRILANIPARDVIVHFHQWTKALSPSVLRVPQRHNLAGVVTAHDYFLACPNGAYFHYPRLANCCLQPLSAQCIAARCDSRSYGHKLVRVVRQSATSNALQFSSRPLHVVHVSGFARAVLGPLLPSHIPQHVLPNPVLVCKLDPAPVHRNRWFTAIGRFTVEKGLEDFADVAKRLDIPARFIGEGPLVGRIRELCPNAQIMPWVSGDQLLRRLREARALLFPSLWQETFGMVAHEALSQGIPVIASRTTAPAEQIEDASNGFLIDPGNQEQLVVALERLRDDRLVRELGLRAYSKFWAMPPTLDRHLDGLIAIYERALNEATPQKQA
jgi:glycosyltransferase involved in cell wall biosynthesis